MFLSDDELIRLTGFKRRSCQIRWLQENGVRHRINGLGHAVVETADLRPQAEPPASEPEGPRLVFSRQ